MVVGHGGLAALLTGEDAQLYARCGLSAGHHLCDEHHVRGIVGIVCRLEDAGSGSRMLSRSVRSGSRHCLGIAEGALCCGHALYLVSLSGHERAQRANPLVAVEVGHAAVPLDDVAVLWGHACQCVGHAHHLLTVEAYPVPSVHHGEGSLSRFHSVSGDRECQRLASVHGIHVCGGHGVVAADPQALVVVGTHAVALHRAHLAPSVGEDHGNGHLVGPYAQRHPVPSLCQVDVLLDHVGGVEHQRTVVASHDGVGAEAYRLARGDHGIDGARRCVEHLERHGLLVVGYLAVDVHHDEVAVVARLVLRTGHAAALTTDEGSHKVVLVLRGHAEHLEGTDDVHRLLIVARVHGPCRLLALHLQVERQRLADVVVAREIDGLLIPSRRRALGHGEGDDLL